MRMRDIEMKSPSFIVNIFLFVVVISCGIQVINSQVTVVDQPDNVTVCVGGTAFFTCVVDITNVIISKGDVRWWRKRTDVSSGILLISENNVRYKVTNSINDQRLNSTLMITHVISTLSGPYWPGLTRGNELCEMAFLSIYEVNFIAPPQNITVTRGSNVTISCGHVIDSLRPVKWIINGTSFSQEQIFFSPFYRQNRQSTPSENSLIVFSINGTTTFQCVVLSTPNTTSTLGTVTVIGPLPVITMHPMDATIQLLANFTNHTLTCEANGASSYKWERKNVIIPSDSTGVFTYALTLVSLQPADTGYYRCVATNAMGSSTSKYATVTLSIHAPLIVTHPTDTSAGSPFGALFNCSIQAYGYLTITWYRSNKNPVPSKASSMIKQSVNVTTSILYIPNVTSEDVDAYYCEAWANRMAAQSLRANLSLADPPSPTVVIKDPIVNLTINNYNLTMKCLPEKNHFNYKWMKRSDTLPSRAQGVNSPQLTIVNLKPEDSGDYQCVMSNRTGAISSSFVTIYIKASLPTISEQPSNVTVNFYESVSLNCTAYGFGVLKVFWKRVKHPMPVMTEVTEKESLNKITSILKITKTTGYYSGQYYCVAKNEVGEVVSKIANLYVQGPAPEMIMHPENVTVFPNENFTMSCLASSFGLLKYDWIKQDGVLPQTAIKSCFHDVLFNPLGEETTNTYNLAVYNVQPIDEGWYCCVATNEAGSIMDCAWMDVNTVPNIIKQPKSQTFKVRDVEITAMSCSAVGIGPIYYQWEKYNSSNGGIWISPSNRSINITSSELKFSIITEEDEGVYRCIVTNDDGAVISDNATIGVYGPPIMKFITNHTAALEGDKVSLMCSAVNDVDAIHPVQVSWYKGNTLVTPKEKHIILYNKTDSFSGHHISTMLFDPVKHTDDGVYTCRAFNDKDSFFELKTKLIVQCPPVVSIINESPYITSVGKLAILYCKATCKPTPIVQWYINDIAVNAFPILYSQSFLVVPTHKSHTIVYTCKGINHIGNIKYTSCANITVAIKDD